MNPVVKGLLKNYRLFEVPESESSQSPKTMRIRAFPVQPAYFIHRCRQKYALFSGVLGFSIVPFRRANPLSIEGRLFLRSL